MTTQAGTADKPAAKPQYATILSALHESDNYVTAMQKAEPEILKLLGAERLTVYQRTRNDREIVSRYQSGTELTEIRVPLSPSSISGYVAMSQRTLLILDAYDAAELISIHPTLKFNQTFDKKSGFWTKSVITLPIKYHDVLLGVFQALNKKGGGVFSMADLANASEITKILAQKFHYELKTTSSPFEHLLQKKKIKQNQLDDFTRRAEKEGTTVAQLLLSDGGITKSELGESLSRYYQVPFVEYDPSIRVPTELLQGIKESYLQSQRWVPISGNRDEVTILIDDPSDAPRIMEIQRTLSAGKYVFKLALADDIRRYLTQGNDTGDTAVDLHELVGRLQVDVQEDLQEVADSIDENEATVIQLVNRLIQDAYEARASDIHIEPGKGKANAAVRLRVDGACRPSLSIPPTHIRAVISRIKIMSGLDISERRKPQDGKCAVRVRGQPIELRVATVPTVHGEGTVMRILSAGEPLPLNKLNLSERNLAETTRLISSPHGIFMVVGPTGSGKTTTLHGVLGHLNAPDTKIWTAEDPVEITQPGLQQVQVNPSIGFDFATALRAFLRADPDVIMIGEMRDRETAHSAVEASLTGHLVLSTLHTNSAPETITRLLDLGLDPVSFSDALLGVLAQRLVRTLCAECKASYPLPESEYNVLLRYYGEQYFQELDVRAGATMVYKPVGCKACANTGYRGRTGIHELLVASDQMRSLIYKNASVQEIRHLALSQGMRTLMQDGIQKLFKGLTDLEQIRMVAVG